jgi:hypothetical protein
MEIIITSTDQMTHLEGVAVRVWDGVTAQGTACKVFVHYMTASDTRDTTRFEQELQDRLPPARSVMLSQVL